jgi:hypothetical protein
MQFKMDEDLDNDPSGRQHAAPSTEPLLSAKVPPEVFEVQAILSRHQSLSGQQQQPSPGTAAQVPSNNNEPVGQGSQSRMPAFREDSLEWIDGVEEDKNKVPTRNPRSPNLTVKIPPTTGADSSAAAAGSIVDGGGSKQRERFVPMPSQTPDAPLSPELKTPLWKPNEPPLKK